MNGLELLGKTRDQLREVAAVLEIRGRGRMNKDQLLEACVSAALPTAVWLAFSRRVGAEIRWSKRHAFVRRDGMFSLCNRMTRLPAESRAQQISKTQGGFCQECLERLRL